jgi:outer membrane protein
MSLNTHRIAMPVVGLLCLLMLAPWAQAQTLRIGYTDVELVLRLMPEFKQVNLQLQQEQQKLMTSLDKKQKYLEQKFAEYQQQVAQGKLQPGQEAQVRQELVELDNEIKNSSADAEKQLLDMQDKLLSPLRDKIADAIEEIAKTDGFTYVFTTQVGQSASLLHAPAEDDITLLLLKKLNIPIPDALNKN